MPLSILLYIQLPFKNRTPKSWIHLKTNQTFYLLGFKMANKSCELSEAVSIAIFLSHFAHFHTVDYVTNNCSFLLMTSKLFKKVPMEKKSSHYMSGTILFLALFAR